MTKQQLCKLIPHDGSMCLLESVDSWDESQIVCSSKSHHNPDNPLKDGNRLGCVNAIEYGAQAVAIHGRLLAEDSNPVSQSGFLVQIKDLDFDDCDLSVLPGALTIKAQQLHCDRTSMLYRITIKHDHNQIMQGRVMIFITEQSSAA